MVAVSARAPIFVRGLQMLQTFSQHAFPGGKRKRDESTHTAPQPSPSMAPRVVLSGLDRAFKRCLPKSQGALDDEVRALPRPRFPLAVQTLVCHRWAGKRAAAQAAEAKSAGDPPASTQDARGAQAPTLLVSALQPPHLEWKPVGGAPLAGSRDATDEELEWRPGGESLAAAAAALTG